MSRPETPLEMAERHVLKGEGLIARQQALVAKLAHQGHHSMLYEAVVFLQALQAIQRQHIALLDRLRE